MGKAKDRWLQLRKSVEIDDGLEVRKAQTWTEDKLWWWNRYIDITTGAFVGRNKWPYELVYVDLFAGPGILEFESGERIPGSPLLAMHAAKPLSKVLLCEKNRARASVCETRVQSVATTQSVQVFVGDCNEQIDAIAQQIPEDSLTIAFVDPTGLHAHFKTIQTLASGRNVDLLILLADWVDIIRNIETTYVNNPNSKLDKFLGPDSNWRTRWSGLADHNAAKVSKLFASIYEDQLRKHLGYTVFADEVLRFRQGAPLYRVLFASKHKLGLKFWRESTKNERAGPRLF